MPRYSVEIKNLAELQKAMRKFPDIAERRMQTAIESSAAEVHKQARRGNVPWKTGNLVQSFGVVLGRLYASIAPNRNTPAKYAYVVHEGSGPRIIKPKNGKALFWPGAAHPVKQVKHPGTKANRYMIKIMEKAQPKISQHFDKALKRIIQDIANMV